MGLTCPAAGRSQTGRRDAAIDALKGLAIVGVLILHARFDRFDPKTQAAITDAWRWVQWSVPAFFFAAGRLARQPLDWAGTGRFIRVRAVRLLTLFVAFTVLYKVAKLPLAALGVMPPWEWSEPGGPQLYFLPYLLLSTVVVAIFVAAVRGRAAWLAAATVVTAVSSVALGPTGQTHGPHPALLGVYTASCLAGVYAAAAGPVAATVALLAGSAAAACGTGNANLLMAAVSPALYAALFPAVAAPIARPVVWLGRWSGAIYLWHTPLLMPAVSIVAVRLLGGGTAAATLTLAVTLVGSAAMGQLANRWTILRPFRV